MHCIATVCYVSAREDQCKHCGSFIRTFFYTSWQQLNVIAQEAGIYNDTVSIIEASDDMSVQQSCSMMFIMLK